MARNGNAKGGLDGGFLDTFGIEYNTRALLIDARWTTTPNGQTTPTVMTYAFTKQASDYNAAPNYPAQNLLVGFAELSADQKTAVRTALDLVASFTKLTFTESASGLADDAALRFSQTGGGTSFGTYPWPGSGASGDVFLGSGGSVPAQYFGTDGFLTITHEIGHALGLKHGHETDNHGALTPDRNSNEFSIMTYASYIGSHPPPITTAVNGSSATNYMMYDIAALQVLYGPNWNKVGSGETYTWDAGTGQQSINGKPAPSTGVSSTQKILTTVWTQGAAATYDLQNFSQDQVDDLRPGHWLTFSNLQLADLNNQLPDDAAYKAKGNVYNALLYQGDLRSAIADLITGTGNDTLIGNDRDNKLMAGAGNDIIVAGGGDDTISGGPGADTIHFGPGSDVARDNLGNLNGDTMMDFGFHASVDIVGSRIGRDSVSITPTTATVSAGGSTFQLNGDFAGGGTAGGLIIATRGSGDSAHTELSHVNFLPNLREGVAVNPATVNGVANQTYLSGDGTVAFTVEMKSAVSAFANTLGYYKVGADGKISDVHILFANTLSTASGTTANLGTPGNGERIGFFLIQDGFHNVGTPPDDLSFVFPGTATAANLDAGVAPALFSASRGPLTGAEIFHSFFEMNPGGTTQVLSGLEHGGRELQIGFEDLRTPTGDNDFQDVVIGVRTNHNDIFIL